MFYSHCFHYVGENIIGECLLAIGLENGTMLCCFPWEEINRYNLEIISTIYVFQFCAFVPGGAIGYMII